MWGNVLEKMYLLTEGNVLWPDRLCATAENEECDIMFLVDWLLMIGMCAFGYVRCKGSQGGNWN